MIEIKFKKLHPDAITPIKGTIGAAGYDITACDNPIITVNYGSVIFKYPTGIALEIPAGYTGLLYPRSSIINKPRLHLANSVGVIDSDYRGEIFVCFRTQLIEIQQTDWDNDCEKYCVYPPDSKFDDMLLNLTHKSDYAVKSELESQRILKSMGGDIPIYVKGDRIAQIIFHKLPEISLIESEELSKTDRGNGGFGSTN